ncbi:MAG: glycosyltransferase family 39 protein [Rhodobacteraceae bacterium]|nr:glycosyltransferase family 39 protein [Paracoccaceae bacterium]
MLERAGTAIAIAAFGLVALAGIWMRPLLPVDETRYLAVAWEMHLGGDWLVPHLNGVVYTHKPPLLFWLIDLTWAAFGVSETAARLVGPAFGMATIAGTAVLARRLWPREPGIGGRAALVLAGFGFFAIYAGLTMFDGLLAFAVLLGVLALVVSDGSRRGWIGFGAALALGGLSKGPVILVHLLPVALAMPLWAGTRAGPMLRGLGLSLAVGVLLIGLWLVPAMLAGGAEYREAVLWTQSAGRISGSFGHGRPWWFFLAMLPLMLWPWIWSGPLWAVLRRLDLRGERGLRLCAIWAGSALVIFSLIEGKQVHYLLPTMPAAALVVARAMGRAPWRARPAALVPALVGAFLLALATGWAPDPHLARQAVPGWGMALAGLLFLALAAAAFRLRGLRLAALGLGFALAMDALFLLSAAGSIQDPAALAAAIAPHDGAGIAVLGRSYQGEFSFAGRLQNPVVAIGDLAAAEAWLAATPGAVLVAPLDRSHPQAEPAEVIAFRNADYGIWTAPSGAAPPVTPP